MLKFCGCGLSFGYDVVSMSKIYVLNPLKWIQTMPPQ